MRLFFIILFFTFFGKLFSVEIINNKDSLLFTKIDSTCIETYRTMLNTKLILGGRFNIFSLTDSAKVPLEYSTNDKTNLGIGLSYKGFGVEFQFAPKGANKEKDKFGKSQQFSLSTSANGRRFIYDFYIRFNKGFLTTTPSKISGDTSGAVAYYYRPDIINVNLGFEFAYLFNNKRFSSSAPYDFTQRQKKSAGSFIAGTFFSAYSINADSVIFPDSLKYRFSPAAHFVFAQNIQWGFSFGYTYTYVWNKYWFANIYLLPGLSLQKYNSTKLDSETTIPKVSIGGALQSRFSIGYNQKKYFIAFSFMGNNYTVNDVGNFTLNYKYGSVRLLCGYRFNHRKLKDLPL